MGKNGKKKFVAVAAGLTIAAAVGASAATLGGLRTSDLGANSNSVQAQVENGIAVSWTTGYEATTNGGEGAYAVTGVHIEPIDADETIGSEAEVQLTLKDDAGTSLGEYQSDDGGTTWSVAPDEQVLAQQVYGVSLVINGGSYTDVVIDRP
ncbi:hypothetical protein GCM10009785_09040 [Brooklawnia cerclae]|uniref:Uncharacterized protein n=1 Tax=Brooklawnia cerclae TaxID=349934 RepID=A0ABX0SJS0_9ACTN|nr:hypothetical protein [Brooklawnia cerclae]NIH58169.1 hypothetical protein [Brooklawnia cerclae]